MNIVFNQEGPQPAYSVFLSVHPFIFLVYLSVCPSVRTSICPSVMYETKIWWIFWSRHLLETYVTVPGNTFSVRTSSDDPSETKCETVRNKNGPQHIRDEICQPTVYLGWQRSSAATSTFHCQHLHVLYRYTQSIIWTTVISKKLEWGQGHRYIMRIWPRVLWRRGRYTSFPAT